MAEFVETIIIGGGQAGLAMSHHLAQRGREHVILERARIAERWRSERWESLHFQVPNVMLRLPGQEYAGDDPHGFTHRDGVVRFIVDYAVRNVAPVRCGVEVTRLRRADSGRLRVEAGPLTMEASNVVLATGPWQSPRVPEGAAAVPAGIHQITANRYGSAADLPPGGVLVVGSGASGYQIADDLLQQGRDVHYALRGHRRVPRRYRGRDISLWNDAMGMNTRLASTLPPGVRSPLITGAMGGHTADMRRLARQGATLLGSLRGIEDGRIVLNPDLNANLAAGDAALRDAIADIDAFIAARGIDAPPDADTRADAAVAHAPVEEVEALDLEASGIGSIIWSLGYRFDLGWVDCPILDGNGAPRQQRGVTAEPGVYVLGLHRMHTLASGFLWGVGEDAAFLADHIVGRA